MSEVLFYPLLIASMYTFLKMLEFRTLKWHFLTGVLLAACVLTRYIGVVLLPIYFAVYVYDFFIKSRYSSFFMKKNIIPLSVFLLAFLGLSATFYFPYFNFFFKTSSGYLSPIIAIKTPPVTQQFLKQLLLIFIHPPRIIGWFIIYLSYFTILIAPFSNQLVVNFYKIYVTRKDQHKRFLFLLMSIGLSVFFILLATRHSGKAWYSGRYMLGRYIMYYFPFAIIAFINIKHEISTKMSKWVNFFSISSVSISLLVLFGRFFGTSSWLILSHVSPDIYIFTSNIALILPFFVAIVVISSFYKKYIKQSLILFYAVCFISSTEVNNDHILYRARKLVEYIEPNENAVIYLEANKFSVDSSKAIDDTHKRIEQYLQFWNKNKKISVRKYDSDIAPKEKGYLITQKMLFQQDPLDKLTLNGTTYYYYKTPLNNTLKITNLMVAFRKDCPVFSTPFKDRTISNIVNDVGLSYYMFYSIGLLDSIDIIRNSTKNHYAFSSEPFAYLKDLDVIYISGGIKHETSFTQDTSCSASLYCQFGFMPESKEWDISDGMNYSIYYEDAYNKSFKLFKEYVYPTIEDKFVYVHLPQKRSRIFKLTFSTLGSGNSNEGDWGCIKSLNLIYQ